MSSPGVGFQTDDVPDGYHHGSVETAAIEAATGIVRRRGLAALTVRAVASDIGVTHAALYRHLSSRAVLVDRVAAGWLDVAADRIAPAEDFRQVVERYLAWALESEALYRCAFELSTDADAVAPTSLARLRDLVAASYRADFGSDATETRDGVFAAWGHMHGLLDLYWKRLLRAADDRRAATYIADLVQLPPPRS